MSASDPAIREYVATLCELCVSGRGGECHVPGCALYLNRAPDIPVAVLMPVVWEAKAEAWVVDSEAAGRQDG